MLGQREVNMSCAYKICGKSFATSSNRARHEKAFHGTRNSSETNFSINTATVLQHAFICIVAGCTQSGKIVWVKTRLENAQKTKNPPTQRIIWCYSQWQQSYFDMMKTMAGIEFNQGIPKDIDEPDYLDVSQRNLIVLDDLMSQSGKDNRIANIFTKGIYHRDLSVIYIVQNVFHQGKEMRNIGLNVHYIVLFQSPRDRQQISILARQVNSGRVQEFMNSYDKATSRPHGYLMLDLKPTTDDEQRLKTNMLPGEISALEQYVRRKSYTLVQRAPSVLSNVSEPSSPVSPEPAEINAPQVPETLKPHFLTPPATEQGRPKLKRNFFHNWVDSSDWRPKDLAMMTTPEQREICERRLPRERPKYIPMKPEELAKLSPEERQAYEN